MSQQLLDLGESFESRDNPRKPAAPISYSQTLAAAAQRWPAFAARPRYVSSFDPDLAPLDLLAGYELLGMEPYPHNILLGALLEATRDNGKKLHSRAVVVEPRRASKTTGIWAELIGRCLNNPRHRVAFTAQSGVKASEIFGDIAGELESAWHAGHSEWDVAPFRVRRGIGHESVEFTNGSWIRVYPPDAKSFRSASADTVFIDEAQEHDPAKTTELVGAILPLMDTKPSPQIIVSGTPGKKREGMLWDYLERGRAGTIGILEYSAADDADVEDPDLWPTWHPGIGTLTDLETIAERFDELPLIQFKREYCCIWPIDTSAKAIDPQLWEAARVPWAGRVRDVPSHFALGFDVSPDQSTAAIACAWRDDAGEAHIEVLEHKVGDAWLAKWLAKYAINRPGVPLGYDNIGNNVMVADAVGRLRRGKPALNPIQTRQMAAATASIFSELVSGTIHHYDQPSLNVAVDGAGRRGLRTEGGWYWGRRASKTDITPLVASTAALAALDRSRPRARARIRSAK